MWATESEALEKVNFDPRTGDTRVTWSNIVAEIQPFLEAVATRLSEQIQAFDPDIAVYAQYALTNQGKQLRPSLMALAAQTVGKINDTTVTAATIIEMVHLATLVHDDIMDEASLRRGQPTVAANWGNEVSVLLGDCLFAQALQLAASFPTPEVCGLVAAATKTVCSGEILQTRNCYRLDVTQEEYFRILNMKTGELFGLSCDLGGGLAGATAQQRKLLRQFGLDLGTAYQIYDDCLDFFGTESLAGKSLGTDLVNGILTLPSLLLLEKASPTDQEQVRNLLASFERANLAEVLRLLDKYDALSQCQRVVDELCTQARHSLSAFPCASGREVLGQVAHFLAQQTRQLGVVQ